MSKLLYYDYSALIVYLLILVAWLQRARKSIGRRSVYLYMLIIAILANIYDIFTIILDNTGNDAITLKYIMNCGYLILRNLITPIYGAYIISVTDTWHTLYKKSLIQVLIWCPFGAAALLTLSSPFTHYVFFIDEAGKYTRGPAFLILYVSAVFYFVFCSYYCVKYFKVLTLERFIPLFSIIPFSLISVIVQLVSPNILCEMFATSLCLLLVMVTIERPEEKIDLSTGLLKSNIFMDSIIQAHKVMKPCCIVLLNITNYSALSSYLSFKNMESVFSKITSRMDVVKTHLHISPELYNLENGLFGVIFYGSETASGTRYARHILETLKHDYNINGITVSVLPNAFVIQVPDDTNDVEEIRLLISDFRNAKYSAEPLLAPSVMKSKDYSVMANIDAILNNAIENDGFEVYYQPIYSNPDHKFNSAEALIRLNTKEYGFIRPDFFIPLAEESGLIHQIGMIVFEKVCAFIASDAFKLLGLDYIEVNLSVVQCMDSELVDKITSLCEKYGVKPSQINLEITETASTFAQDTMTNNINSLYKLGFPFSLDDFGTGYSNMVRIASLPLHIVKLDKSFTWTENNSDLKLILENTIQMVKEMGMKIVVEGVETEDMLKTFTDLACEYIQGYYFSKPLPKDDFVKYITEHQPK